jgi:hypothetical protein
MGDLTNDRTRRRRTRLRQLLSAATIFVAGAIVAAVLMHGSGGARNESTAFGAKGDTTVDVHSANELKSAIQKADDGDTIVLHAGTYPQTTIDRRWARTVTLEGAPGENVTVAGFYISNAAEVAIQDLQTTGESDVVTGSRDVTFDNVTCTLKIGDRNDSCFYLHDNSSGLTVRNSSAVGGFDGVKIYGCSGSNWTSNITISDNDLSQSSEDMIHVNCGRNITVMHNYIHDPVDNADHNDGIQSQASDGLQIIRNTFTFTHSNPNGPNQGIILGRTGPPSDDLVTNTLVSGNLIHHWPGIGIILDGTQDTDVVNNTVWDGYQGFTLTGTAAFANTGVRVWNNIFSTLYLDPGSRAADTCAHNLVGERLQNGVCQTDARTGNPHFVNARTYLLQPDSPAWGDAGTLAATPSVDLDGKRCRQSHLGARCLRS